MRRVLSALLLMFAATLARAEVPATADALFAATLARVDDRPAALVAWQGKPLIVNFWARWCGPCRVEIPELIKLGAAQRAQGLEVIGIAIEDKGAAVGDFARAYEIDYAILVAGEQGIPLMQALGNSKSGLPFTVAVDRRGRIVASKLGAMSPTELQAAALAALR